MVLVTGLGERLKEARKAKGYSLDDLQAITKIQKRYLSGIENEDFSMMPGAFYVRAFIKQYAEAVGLNPDELLSLYKDSSSSIESIEEEQTVVPTQLKRRRGIKSSKVNEMIPKFIVALFIIVIIAVVYVLVVNSKSDKGLSNQEPPNEKIRVENKQEDTNKGKKDDPVVTEDPVEEEEPVEEPEEVKQSLTFKEQAGENATYVLTNADALKLEIRTTGDSWIGVRDEAQVEHMPAPGGARVMVAGESIQLDMSQAKTIRIRVGRTQGTEIYVNDELLPYHSNLVTQNVIIEYEK